MESIAYLINRNFILIAVDTNYETEVNGIKIKLNRAKKAYKLNDNNLIAVIGNPYKITDIYKYILKLNELGQNESYNQIVEDIKDVFNSSKIDITEGLTELTKLLPMFYDNSGYVKTNELFEKLKEKPELISILKDAIPSINNSMPALTQILVFGWLPELGKTNMANFISLGQNLTGSDSIEMNSDFVYIRLASSSVDSSVTSNIEQELVKELSPLLQSGWDKNNDITNSVIEKGKEILSEGLQQICPYTTEPNIIFYELSYRTDYRFIEPELELSKIEYNRNK